MIALTNERKQQIIDEEPEGLCLVLDEEYPRELPIPTSEILEDLLLGEPDDVGG